jgi:hypothetical protein
MNLQTIPISDSNVEQIQSSFKAPYELNSHMFMQMYTVDQLGESIPNTPTWLNQIFGSLNTFKYKPQVTVEDEVSRMLLMFKENRVQNPEDKVYHNGAYLKNKKETNELV